MTPGRLFFALWLCIFATVAAAADYVNRARVQRRARQPARAVTAERAPRENSWVELDGLRMQSVSGGGHFGGGLFISRPTCAGGQAVIAAIIDALRG